LVGAHCQHNPNSIKGLVEQFQIRGSILYPLNQQQKLYKKLNQYWGVALELPEQKQDFPLITENPTVLVFLTVLG